MTQVKERKNDEIRESHIKKLLELSKPEGQLEFHVDGSVWKNGKLIAERPTEEQEERVKRRMRGSARSWETWDQK